MIWGDGLYLCSAAEFFGKLYQHHYVPQSSGVIVRAAQSHILKGSQSSVDAEHCFDPPGIQLRRAVVDPAHKGDHRNFWFLFHNSFSTAFPIRFVK